ncbi:hypothetical protein BC332_09273 [Capsicum chinense]|nr:hypothetical protein BC332_09273 [Capsicum chinense]
MALNFHSSALLFNLTPTTKFKHYSSSLGVRCSAPSSSDEDATNKKKKRLSQQSSWEAEDSEGNDYLYRLGAEADNMNIAVGAKAGVIDSLFAGNFLGKDSDIVFDYRQKVTRSFAYLQGDYYVAPAFLDKVGKLQSAASFFSLTTAHSRDHCVPCV